MGPDKTNIDEVDRKLDDDNNPVVVSHNIEDITLIADSIDRIESPLDICEIMPLAMSDDVTPLLKRSLCLRMDFNKFLQCLFGKYPHMQT